MTFNHHSAIRPAMHLAFESPTAERLLKLGATNVVRASDCLILGPSHRDAHEHVRLRAAWWGPSDEKWDRLYSPDVRWSMNYHSKWL